LGEPHDLDEDSAGPAITGVAMNAPFHMVVWIDHQVARLFALTQDAFQETPIHNSDTGHGHVHHHAGTGGAGHVALDRTFLDNISEAIGGAQEILIVGPAGAKTALKSFLDDHKPLQAANVMGVEAMDHASDGQIAAFARHFFERADRMRNKPE
jgi:hypothetical protein